jgi:hypothetical protein
MGSKTHPTPNTPNTTDPVASAWGSIGAHISWANTKDRSKRTAPGRAAFEQKFLDEADGDPVRAEHARRAYFRRMALNAAKARASRKTESGVTDDARRRRTSTRRRSHGG